METANLHSPDISCDGCAQAIKRILSATPGVSSVNVDVPSKLIAVEYDEAQVQLPEIKAKLSRAGYDT